MLSKHYILCVYFHIVVSFGYSVCVDTEKSQTSINLDVLKNALKSRESLVEVTPYFNISITTAPPNCVQMVCKFVCFNGRARDIDHDIDVVALKNNFTCDRIEELRLYNYEFDDNTLSYGFLGKYSDKVEILYVASSNVSDVAPGTFANGVFQEIYFENLKLVKLKKDFFQGINSDFNALSVIQKEYPLKQVNVDFLDIVTYQMKYLTMQVGLSCIRNLTGSQNLLSNLIYMDFSFNNLSYDFTSAVFSKVSMVEHIDLSHSKLEYIPPYIFSDFTSTLEYLDLSYNNLKTLSRTIFGWQQIPRELKIYANDNAWQCSCDFQNEMKQIFIFQTTQLVCSEPAVYANWSVFDDRICEIQFASTESYTTMSIEEITSAAKDDEMGQMSVAPSEQLRPSPKTTTVTMPSTMQTTSIPPDEATRPDFFELQCIAGPQSEEHFQHHLQWPLLEFDLLPQEQLMVEVIIETPSTATFSYAQDLNESFGLIWFSKVTTQYYKMEINYNEYGLGCYNSLSYVTTVSELIPNVAYTFCMVLKDQLTISPFNCKSIHVGSNLSVQYSAWLTRDMKVTGLSLVIFGVVMFSFAGLLMIYILLKRKPILLKGSKRVTMSRNNGGDIVVMPREKSLKTLKEKEIKLAKRGTIFCGERRRRSVDSVASYQSYMNTNLYEVIPAYLHMESNLQDTSTTDMSIVPPMTSSDMQTCEFDCSYITPLNTVSSTADLVNYAEIPYRSKRVSNDPLPEVPNDQETLHEASLERSANSDIGVIYMLDSQV